MIKKIFRSTSTWWVICLFCGLIISGASSAQSTDPVQQWLLSGCQVGNEGQDQTVLSQYGSQAVPELVAAAQSGPSTSDIEQLQADASVAYYKVQSVLATSNLGAVNPSYVTAVQTQTLGQFVTQETNAFVVLYEVRAVQGLAVVVNQQALEALQSLAATATLPQVRQSAQQSLTGLADVNKDGAVNCLDLSIVKASFGKRAGQQGFNPAADVNKDGVIDILDLSFVAKQIPVGTVCN